MSIQAAREKMAATRGKALAFDSGFFAKIDATAEKLDATQGHPADWRRLRAEVATYAKSISESPTWDDNTQAAWDHAQARIAYCDAKIGIQSMSDSLTPGNARRASDPHVEAFNQWLRAPQSAARKSQLTMEEEAARLHGSIQASGNSLTGAAGGFAVPAPVAEAIGQRIKEISPLRQLAANYSVTSTGTKFLVNRNNAASSWVGETDERTGTAEPTLDNRAPTYGTVYGLVEATEELLLDSAVDVGQWFADAVVQQIAQSEGAAFVSGNGTNKPTGFLAGPTPVTTPDATRAAGTLQYVAGGHASQINSVDALTDLFFALKAAHRSSASWLMSSATAAAVMKLKDTDGRSLWHQSLSADTPSTLLGRPVFFAEDMPAIGANNFPIAFGNFGAGYLITDSGDLRITVDDNLTKPGYVRWYVRRRVGGVIYDSEAIKLLKVATS
jgi:HK97 family phage major capsid protein